MSVSINSSWLFPDIEIRFYGPKSSRKWRKSDIDYRYFYTFVFNSDLYSVRDKEIIKYETIGNNELKEREICTIPNDNTYWEFLHHYARNTMVTNGNLEFDGEKCIVLERQISIDNLRTSKAWYSYKTQLSLK